MKRVAPALLAGLFGLAACSSDSSNPMTPVDAGLTTNSLGTDAPGLNPGQPRLPLSGRLSHRYSANRVGLEKADRYMCSNVAPIIAWNDGAIGSWRQQEPEIYRRLVDYSAHIVPDYDAWLVQTTATPQYFGYNGEYTDVLLRTEKHAKRFWDIRSDDIQLIGMHGAMLLDEEQTTKAHQAIWESSPEQARAYATFIGNTMRASQAANGGNHPLFSFGAYASSGLEEYGIPDKIVIGDGILAGFQAVGLGDVAAQALYGHEFAHQIQWENNYRVTEGSEAEQSRYIELMADAMSAYFLTHKRGAAMNKKRVEMFLEAFFQIGDCNTTLDVHHGTPKQRMAAARFGFALADEAQKQGHILTSAQVHARFVAAYPQLIAS